MVVSPSTFLSSLLLVTTLSLLLAPMGAAGSSDAKCACVFDFDLTLRIIRGGDQDYPAPDGKQVIQRCKVR